MTQPKCKNKLTVYVEHGYSIKKIEVKCGTWLRGYKELCLACTKQAEKDFPQGWKYYPGDVCEHGTYIGGCGIDHMCPMCENE